MTGSAKPRVLVVDEDLLFTVRIETTLRKLGYDVFVTGNAEEAVTIAEAMDLSLVIINFGREGLQPMETTAKLKAVYQPALVLGYISHKLIPGLRDQAREAGCDMLVANSAMVLRLVPLVERLAPIDGSAARIVEAEELAEEQEDAAP